MRALRLELSARRRWSLAGAVALAAALFVLGDTLWRAVELNDEATRLEQDAGRQGGRRPAPAQGLKLDPALQRDVRFAEQVVQRLALPWDQLFATIEAASSDQVALLAVEPDAQRGELVIAGEAADYKAVLAYLSRLGQPGGLRGVHLVRHEIKQDDPQRPLLFTIGASWSAGR